MCSGQGNSGQSVSLPASSATQASPAQSTPGLFSSSSGLPSYNQSTRLPPLIVTPRYMWLPLGFLPILHFLNILLVLFRGPRRSLRRTRITMMPWWSPLMICWRLIGPVCWPSLRLGQTWGHFFVLKCLPHSSRPNPPIASSSGTTWTSKGPSSPVRICSWVLWGISSLLFQKKRFPHLEALEFKLAAVDFPKKKESDWNLTWNLLRSYSRYARESLQPLKASPSGSKFLLEFQAPLGLKYLGKSELKPSILKQMECSSASP